MSFEDIKHLDLISNFYQKNSIIGNHWLKIYIFFDCFNIKYNISWWPHSCDMFSNIEFIPKFMTTTAFIVRLIKMLNFVSLTKWNRDFFRNVFFHVSFLTLVFRQFVICLVAAYWCFIISLQWDVVDSTTLTDRAVRSNNSIRGSNLHQFFWNAIPSVNARYP